MVYHATKKGSSDNTALKRFENPKSSSFDKLVTTFKHA